MNNRKLIFSLKTLIEQLEVKKLNAQKHELIDIYLERLQDYVHQSDLLDDNTLEKKLVIFKNERNVGLKEIKDFTKDASKLIIIDPYFLSVPNSEIINFEEEFKKVTQIHNLKKLSIIYNPKMGKTNNYVKGLKKICRENGCSLKINPTEAIHDRVWIKDRKKAVLVGNSFGGIGLTKLSFIIDLPEKDLDTLLLFLDENKFI